jgi:hypothetical protein
MKIICHVFNLNQAASAANCQPATDIIKGLVSLFLRGLLSAVPAECELMSVG